MTYNELKIKVLEKYFSRTNPMQRQAIFTINGAVLIIAGAGSGKTTVLCNRIANMVLFGNSYNKNTNRELSDTDREFAESYLNGEIENFAAAGRLSEIFGEDIVKPWRILAVTFTNKATEEMKSRIVKEFSRLIFGDVENSILSIDVFGALDTTRIFAREYRWSLDLDAVERKLVEKFDSKFRLNRVAGGLNAEDDSALRNLELVNTKQTHNLKNDSSKK
jgi:hypothetical protein